MSMSARIHSAGNRERNMPCLANPTNPTQPSTNVHAVRRRCQEIPINVLNRFMNDLNFRKTH
jgi:hypothetical protein